MALISCMAMSGQQLKGVVTDAATGEAIVGAVATLRADTEKTTVSDTTALLNLKVLTPVKNTNYKSNISATRSLHYPMQHRAPKQCK